VVPEFSARTVTLGVIEHLERRRPAIVGSVEAVTAEVEHALEPVRTAYGELDLPRAYIDALAEEVQAALPARWHAAATRFTRLESSSFGLWRGGDVVARLTYVFVGLAIGILVLRAPFIPIWEKWFPFVLAIAAWWLPDLQVRHKRRGYERELGAIVAIMERAQPALDARITLAALMPPEEKRSS
jgi:hypothetical protein